MSIFTLPRALGFDSNGLLVSGAKLNFYTAGTSTRKDTYSDVDLTIANPNPVVANSSGLFGGIYLGSGFYKVVLTDSADVVLWTQDDVSGIVPADVFYPITTAEIAAGVTPTDYQYPEGDSRRYGSAADAFETLYGSASGRNLRSVVDSALPAYAISDDIVVRKLRTDYEEFDVFTPASADGFDWCRWYFSNRVTAGNMPRLLMATRAALYASTDIAVNAENGDTGTETLTPASTEATTDSTGRTGTWTGPVSVGGVTDIQYSVNVGDSVTYEVTSAARITLRTIRNSTHSPGAVAKVVITDSMAAEISSANYLVPLSGGDRVIDMNLQVNLNGLCYIPLADGLTPGTYTVVISVHSSHTADRRVYEGGLRVNDADIAYDDTGLMGTWVGVSAVIDGRDMNVGYYPGVVTTYQLTDATKVIWKAGMISNGGTVDVRVYDSIGAEIDSGDYDIVGNEVDLYRSSSTAAEIPIASGLTKGTYYLQVTNKNTKNASSSAYRVYEYGAASVDETTAGVPGSGSFDLLGDALIYQAANPKLGSGKFIWGGNVEQAIEVKKTSQTHTSKDFVSGVHTHDTAPTSISLIIDGSAVDYASAAARDQWVCQSAEYRFTNNLLFPDDTGPWATNVCNWQFSKMGYHPVIDFEVTADADVYHDYSLMLNVPHPGVDGGGAEYIGVDGGFGRISVDGDTNYEIPSDGSTDIYRRCLGAVFWSDDWMVYAFGTNEQKLADVFTDPRFHESPNKYRAEFTVRTGSQPTTKYYNLQVRATNTGPGVPYRTAMTYRSAKLFRVVRASGMLAAMGG
jgi:hypothetical protein